MTSNPVIFCAACGAFARVLGVIHGVTPAHPVGLMSCSCGGTEFLAEASSLGMLDGLGKPLCALVPMVVIP